MLSRKPLITNKLTHSQWVNRVKMVYEWLTGGESDGWKQGPRGNGLPISDFPVADRGVCFYYILPLPIKYRLS